MKSPFKFRDSSGVEHTCIRTDHDPARCKHRPRQDPLPCAVPSCPATCKSPVVIRWINQEDKDGALAMRRKFTGGKWEWVPAV